jgi:hypothetical protein|tara:strand:+ start:266 stop:445 length:180 start_codon:yes stop_codon:yes gene_type:complete
VWRKEMKVGDLVKYNALGYTRMGIIVGFDRDDDPIIRESESGVAMANWRIHVEVISESR